MKATDILMALGKFLFFFGLGIAIPNLVIEWFNFQEYSITIKMIFVVSSMLIALGYLIKPLTKETRGR